MKTNTVMKPIYLVLLIVFTGITFSGCKKDKPGDTTTRDAVLYWTGDVAVDGCGFIIEIAGTEFKPYDESVIDDSFKQQDQTEVVVEYRNNNEHKVFVCGLQQQHFGIIHVVSIHKK